MNLSVAVNQRTQTIDKRLFWARMWGKSIEVPKQVVDLCSCAMAERGFMGVVGRWKKWLHTVSPRLQA